MNVREVGSFIRSQRTNAKMSLRGLSSVVGVSIPYLSQIERGLRKPSADILQAIAKGLRVSAETLYVKAGILEDRPVPDVATTIMGDQNLTERQKQALVQIYDAFRGEGGRDDLADRQGPADARVASSPVEAGPAAVRRPERPSRTRSSQPKAGGRAKTVAIPPHPAPLRSPATSTRKEV